MKTIRQIRLAFLAETVAHYNLYNRAWDGESKTGNGCTYSPVTNVSEGCAVGRHIKDKALCAKLDSQCGGVNMNSIFNQLPNKLKRLGQDFLTQVQTLHDYEKNWDENGLTSEGKERVKLIKIHLVE